MTEQAIEFLGWLPMSDRLKGSMARAYTGAVDERASEISIEHVLRAFDEDVDVNVYLARCGVERGRIAEVFALGSAEGERGPALSAPDDDASQRGASGLWHRTAEDPYGVSPAGRDHSRYGDGYASASLAKSRPQPGRALRRLMAKASAAAERVGAPSVTSELTLQVLALDDEAEEGRRLAEALPPHERARLAARLRTDSVQAPPQIANGPDAPGGASFKSLAGEIETVLMTLHAELQKDMRYRIANDLASFITQTRPGDEGLQNSALPILHATRAELERDAHFLALERIRGALRAIRSEEARIRAALGGLAREGRLEPDGALAQAAAKLVELPASPTLDPEGGVAALETEPAACEAPPFAGPALVQAARAGASPWEGLGAAAAARADAALKPSPAAQEEDPVEEVEPLDPPSPLLGRVLRSVRPGAVFGRRRSGAA